MTPPIRPPNAPLPKETNNFLEGEIAPPDQSIIKANQKLLDLQIKDYEWKVNARKPFGRTIIGILIAQNLAMYALVFAALGMGQLASIQYVVGAIIAGTLLETNFCVKYLLRWLFTDISYKLHPSSKHRK